MALALLMFAAAATAPMRLIDDVDPITGRSTVHAVIGTNREYVAVGCDGGKPYRPEVIIRFGRQIREASPGILAGGRELIYRFDEGKPGTVRWYSWKDKVMAGEAPTRPMPFIKALMQSRRVALRTAGKGDVRLDLTFDYTDPADLIGQALQKCGVALP